MKVSQLIEALSTLPPDVEIVTHANNHDAGPNESMQVALCTYRNAGQVAFIGNWGAYHLAKPGERYPSHPQPVGEVFCVLRYGETKGTLVRRIPVWKPETTYEVKSVRTTEARWEMVDVP